MRRIFLILLALTAVIARAELTVSLLTIDPGPEIYQLEGHTELRFVDPDRGLDSTVSWGVFDFDSDGFVYRFVKGETDYLAASYPFGHFLAANGMSGRRVTEQTLNLTPNEAERLLELVADNLRPENRVYRYNYVKDNCATRPLTLIEQAADNRLAIQGYSADGATWRSEMTRYHANYPWYQFGIDLALGSGIDQPLDARQMCYAPANLHDYISHALKADGTPLVAAEATLLEGDSDGKPMPPTPWYLTPLFVSWLLLIAVALSAWHDIRQHRPSRLVYTGLYGIAFVASLLLTYLIFVSTHEATTPNWIYLWLNPLTIIGAISTWLKKHNRVVYCYQIVNFVALTALVIIGLTGVQHLNPAFYLLIACYMITSVEYLYICRK